MESAGTTRQHRIQTPPLDTRFVMDLPDELQPCFNGWATNSQIEPELNVWRQLNFSNGPCFGLLKKRTSSIMRCQEPGGRYARLTVPLPHIQARHEAALVQG